MESAHRKENESLTELPIGSNIRARRKEKNLTQEDLAAVLRVTKAAVSKWECSETYPDLPLLPAIADTLDLSMDELFGYHRREAPVKIVTEYRFGCSLSDFDSMEIFDHCSVGQTNIQKVGDEPHWEVLVQLISEEPDFPTFLQRHLKPGKLIDAMALRKANGKIIEDDLPNKVYVCREKIWEYRNTDHAYVRRMIREQAEMGLIDEEDAF